MVNTKNAKPIARKRFAAARYDCLISFDSPRVS